MMKRAIEIIKDVYWVGVRDTDNRHFHGELYPVDEGVTYNAYLVIDDQVTLFDTVEEEYTDECLERIESILNGRAIDNIIVQHAEPDHSGGFRKVYAKYPEANVYASVGGVKNMKAQYLDDVDFQVLKTNDTLCTGKYNFTFVEMQMIHWPDNLLTYSPELKTVFSNDAFGQHIVNYQLTDENLDVSYCLHQAKEYFANIVLSYTAQVNAKLKLIESMNLDIDYIMPAHGIIWKQYVNEILNAYKDYAALKNKHKAIIVYETVWNHTKEIADALAEGFAAAGMEVKLYKLSNTKSSIVFRELMDAKIICLGTGTYNNAMSYSVAAFLEHLKASKVKGKKGLSFGAYGWFPKVPSILDEQLQAAGLESVDTPIAQVFSANEDQLEQYYQSAKQIGESL